MTGSSRGVIYLDLATKGTRICNCLGKEMVIESVSLIRSIILISPLMQRGQPYPYLACIQYSMYYYKLITYNIQLHMIPTEQQHLDENSIFAPTQHQGKIQQLCCKGYYSNPQICVFATTYCFSLFLVVLMVTQVFVFDYHVYIGRFLCLYILYRYMNLALSDPGLARLNPIKILENHRFCHTCKIYVRKFTRHCQICDVCVEAYDHHCIFIGKCIGKNNMGQFKQFLCLIFSTLVYGLVLSMSYATNIKVIETQVQK